MAQNKTLHELNVTRDKFFSIIAHDLRNPFTNLMLLSELLQTELRHYTVEQIEKYIKTMYQASKQGYNLLENLLEWSRSQTGRIRFQPEQVHLREIVTETLYILKSSAHNKQITLLVEIPEHMYAFADRNMIKTIIRNVISNAVFFHNTHNLDHNVGIHQTSL